MAQEEVMSIQSEVSTRIASITTKLPTYQELNKEEQEIVDSYIAKIDITNPKSINEFGKEGTEEIYNELDILIGTLKTNDVSISNMFTDLMMTMDQGTNISKKEGFIKTLVRSPGDALKLLANKPKQMIKEEQFRRTQLLTNIRVIGEKLEGIRNQVALNVEKLDYMANNSAKQFGNVQSQIIALTEFQRRMELEQTSNSTDVTNKTFDQIEEELKLQGVNNKISRKIENLQGVRITAANKAIMSRLLSQHNEGLANDYEQDISTLLPELKSVIVTAEDNDTTIRAIDTHNEFVGKMNEVLRNESNRSKEAIHRIQEISKGSAIDVETAKALTQDVLEVVKSTIEVQKAGRPKNQAFVEIFDEFRKGLERELTVEDSQLIQRRLENEIEF